MKKCPQCNRTYADESFSFCLEDGALLSASYDPDATLVIPAAINSEAHSSKTAVMSPEDGEAFAETPRPSKRGGPKRTKLTEQSFYESLDPKTAKALRDFFAKALDLGIGLKKDSGQGSLMLKLGIGDKEYNLGAFKKNGEFQNYRIARYTEKHGYPEIGEQYLKQLASLFEDGYVDSSGSDKFTWTIKKRNNQYITISEILAVQDKWLQIIRDTADKLRKHS